MPIKSILMVTHNIEEAVLMADRILVLSSNPGRIAAEIPVTIPHPRDRLDPEFRPLVDKIYALMTQRPDPTQAGRARGRGGGPRHGAARCLHQLARRHARGDRRAALQRQGGPAASRRLAADTRSTTCFPSAKRCSCCTGRIRGGRHQADAAGKRFVDMDVDQRKKLIGEQVLANMPLAAHIKRVLDERPSHRAPAIRFREELEDYMSEDYADRTLRTVINLGRYGELFAYDEDAQTFSYENPQ